MMCYARFAIFLLCCHFTAQANTIIDVNPSWAELNYQQVDVVDDSDRYAVFDAHARGFGIDLRFAVADQWALLVAASSLGECYETFLFGCSNDNAGYDEDAPEGWYKKQAVGVNWSQALARRYAVEVSYRYNLEAYRLHDNFCFMLSCSATHNGDDYNPRQDELNFHLIGVTGRAQWGRYELAVSAQQSFGELDETQWRLENRFLITRFLNLVLSLQGSEEREHLSFGVRGRW